MSQLSLIDKLKVVLSITKSNIFYPVIILFLILVSFLFITTNKNNAKESKKTYGLIYLVIFIIILIKYRASLSTMFDYMMNNLFIVFYFPNIAVYLSAIIITNIIMWISMFSSKTKLSLKIINSLIFSIIHYLFILILNIITTNNINVFEEQALYGNENLHSLIELSSNIFIIWLVFLVIYKIILTYIENNKKKTIYDNRELTVEHITAAKTEHQNTIHLPNNITEVKAPYIVKREMTRSVSSYELPKQSENIEIYDQMLTLEDYKLLVSLLKDKDKEEIKKILTTEKEEKIEEEPKENQLSELMELYKTVG